MRRDSEAVREFKKRFIINVITANKGNQCTAARELGMHRNTLSRTISELGLQEKLHEIRTGVPRRRRRPMASVCHETRSQAAAV